MSCPVCSGDCGAANPPVLFCPMERPPAPTLPRHTVWYCGWEVSFDLDASYWGTDAWQAYKGGCDVDAPRLTASTYRAVLDEVDAAENE